MAIAFDSTSNSSIAFSTSLTWSHTCTGSDRILFIGIWNIPTDNITSVTYNGVSCTLIIKEFSANRNLYLYYLIAPSTGANNIVINCSSSQSINAAACSYTGVSQTGQPDSSAGISTNTNSLVATVTTTVVNNNSWLIGTMFSSGAMTASTGMTSRNTSSTGILGDSGSSVLSGSRSMRATVTVTDRPFAGIIASFYPSSASTANSNFFMFF